MWWEWWKVKRRFGEWLLLRGAGFLFEKEQQMKGFVIQRRYEACKLVLLKIKLPD